MGQGERAVGGVRSISCIGFGDDRSGGELLDLASEGGELGESFGQG
jgi:hypothetical protein